jgi:hypothetical protein
MHTSVVFFFDERARFVIQHAKNQKRGGMRRGREAMVRDVGGYLIDFVDQLV